MEPISPRKGNKKTATIAPEVSFQDAYVDYLLNHGQRPPSVYKFAHDLGMNEDDFYKQFGSFDGLERQIWKGFITRTILRLQTDNAYIAFSAREKLLAFYFTFFEDLRRDRSFVLLQLERNPRLELVPECLKDFKAAFESYIESILTQGKAKGEIANRPYIGKTYPQMFSMQMGFLLMFWKRDNSATFEQTDAAIEKAVNLAFDLIGTGAIDTAFDFAKFLVQTRTK
jgi:AcrR family transcriptional regulator